MRSKRKASSSTHVHFEPVAFSFTEGVELTAICFFYGRLEERASLVDSAQDKGASEVSRESISHFVPSIAYNFDPV
jgi:hypothetical protein